MEDCFASEALPRLSLTSLLRVISSDACDVKELRLFRLVRTCCCYCQMLLLLTHFWFPAIVFVTVCAGLAADTRLARCPAGRHKHAKQVAGPSTGPTRPRHAHLSIRTVAMPLLPVSLVHTMPALAQYARGVRRKLFLAVSCADLLCMDCTCTRGRFAALEHVRLPLISAAELLTVVQPSGVVPPALLLEALAFHAAPDCCDTASPRFRFAALRLFAAQRRHTLAFGGCVLPLSLMFPGDWVSNLCVLLTLLLHSFMSQRRERTY